MADKEPRSEHIPSGRGWKIFEVQPSLSRLLHAPPVALAAFIQIAALMLLVGLISWMVWTFTKGTLLLGVFATTGGDKEQAEAARHLATVGGTFLGGLVATILVVWRTVLTHRQTKVGEDQRRLSEQIHFTTLFTKAVEQLGATREEKEKDGAKDIVKTLPNVSVRIGAIYALGRIGKESITDNIPILDILSSYVRENSPLPPAVDQSQTKTLSVSIVRDDVKAAFDVICSINSIFKIERIEKDHFVYLGKCYLPNMIIHHSTITNFSFADSNLEKADIRHSSIHNCTLVATKMKGSVISSSKIKYCRATVANLTGLMMDGSHIDNSTFSGSDLSNSYILSSNFSACSFDESTMNKVNLSMESTECTFNRMILCNDTHLGIYDFQNWNPPDLRKCKGLNQENIETMISCENTILPDHLTRPSHWHKINVLDEYGQWHPLTS
jgi:hypothetical protein